MEQELHRLSLLRLRPHGGYRQAELTVGVAEEAGNLGWSGQRVDHNYNDIYFSVSGEPVINAQIQMPIIGPGEEMTERMLDHPTQQ